MAPVRSARAGVGCFQLTGLCGFLLGVLIYSAVCSFECPPKKLGTQDCPQRSISVSRGDTVNFSFTASSPTLDLCKRNGSTSKWDPVYSFSNHGSQPISKDFRENISVSQGRFVLTNMSLGAAGNYTLQDSQGTCRAYFELRVAVPSGGPSPRSVRHTGVAAPWFWAVISLPFLLRWP
ncbi:uncharacterized protein LOC142024646 isoform X2 [Carettochelys insculpta]